MVKKRIIATDRVRRINGGFSFIPHRFLNDGFWASLNPHELLLYLFPVTASDRYGLSYYGRRSICSLTGVSDDEYEESGNRLIARDLTAFSGQLFQVLSLPAEPVDLSESSKRDVGQLLQTIGERMG